MRLLVARCEVLYTGRLTATLPEAVRLLVFKADGSVLVHDDSGAYKPLNWIRSVFRPELLPNPGSFSTPLQDLDIRSILICRVRTIAVFAL
jgi:RecB family endonuclease NucS